WGRNGFGVRERARRRVESAAALRSPPLDLAQRAQAAADEVVDRLALGQRLAREGAVLEGVAAALGCADAGSAAVATAAALAGRRRARNGGAGGQPRAAACGECCVVRARAAHGSAHLFGFRPHAQPAVLVDALMLDAHLAPLPAALPREQV